MVTVDNEMKIISFLISNHERFKEVGKPFVDQKKELLNHNSKYYHDDIKKEFHTLMSFMIAEEIGMQLALSVDDALDVLDSFDLEEYLK